MYLFISIHSSSVTNNMRQASDCMFFSLTLFRIQVEAKLVSVQKERFTDQSGEK